ncbi:uncharacterized protein [Temnothorax nylanderi]|uniref:uncharacterized protein n=1 Tax=Temnothorax nylanderi TaxID=102681 RepID=UPI003A846C3D
MSDRIHLKVFRMWSFLRHQALIDKIKGHPSRQIIPPRKYANTSSSEIEKINASRNDNLNQTINVKNDINHIRNILDTNKENEAAATHSQYASPSMINNCPIPLSNAVAPFYGPPNVNGSTEQYSVPQNKKTYTDLLPLKSTSGFNDNYLPNTSLYGSLNPRNETYYHPAATITTPHAGQAIYGLSQQSPCVAATINQQNPIPLIPDGRIHSNNVTATMGHSDNGSRDTEIRRLHEKLSNVVSKEEFQDLRNELTEHYQSINTKLDKLLHKRINIMPPKPPSFPLQSVQQVTDFNNISQEEYENAVQYLHYIGGFTLHDAIKYCMKEVMADETIRNYSAWEERGNLPLFDTKLIKVYMMRSLVHEVPDLAPVQKLKYLKASLTGETAAVVANMELTDKGYEMAWTELSSRYDNRRVLLCTHMRVFLSSPAMAKASSADLKQLISVALQAKCSFESLGRPVTYWNDWSVHVIVEKLDSQSRLFWEALLRTSSEFPTFRQLQDFLQIRIRALDAANPKGSATAVAASSTKQDRKAKERWSLERTAILTTSSAAATPIKKPWRPNASSWQSSGRGSLELSKWAANIPELCPDGESSAKLFHDREGISTLGVIWNPADDCSDSPSPCQF